MKKKFNVIESRCRAVLSKQSRIGRVPLYHCGSCDKYMEELPKEGTVCKAYSYPDHFEIIRAVWYSKKQKPTRRNDKDRKRGRPIPASV